MKTKSEKKAAYYAAYYQANKDQAKAYAAARRAANPEKQAAYQAAYRAANRQKQAAYHAARRAANPGVMKASVAAWRAANPGAAKASVAKWRAANAGRHRASVAKWRANQYRTNPNFRLRLIIRGHLHRIVKFGGVKDAASISYVGCTVAQLRKHLERQFTPGMTWQNHGEWHIDHITPLAAFDFAAFPAQIKQAEHYTNLRPMWARDNLSKSDALLRPVQLDLIAV